MEKIKLRVSGNQIEVAEHPVAITAGTVGLTAEFTFDSQWDNLAKTAVFKAGDKVVATALEGNAHTIPWEVLEKPNLWLNIGVYGANGEGTVVIPTLWAKVAVVHTGVDPEGDPAMEPTAPVWQTILSRVEEIGDVLHDVDALSADNKTAIDSHINNQDGDNPHGVTCEQIGAVTQEQHDKEVGTMGARVNDNTDKIGNIRVSIDEHIADKENPHGVTCEQIGAGTREEMDTMQGLLQQLDKLTGDVDWEINNHVNNADGDNPHGVTCEQIGAAPAGYGLGESASFADNWNKGYVNAFARSNSNSPDGKMWYGLICRDATNTNTTTEIAFSTEAGNLVSEVRRSRNAAGTWGSWEYVNPPMLEGVEYRTTERWNGMPVYTKLVRADSAKHGAFVDTPGYIIRADGFLSNDEINGLPMFCLPYGQAAWLEIDSTIGISLYFANGYNDIGAEYFFVQIWYLK